MKRNTKKLASVHEAGLFVAADVPGAGGKRAVHEIVQGGKLFVEKVVVAGTLGGGGLGSGLGNALAGLGGDGGRRRGGGGRVLKAVVVVPFLA